MSEVSTFRLYLLRAMYLFTVVGLAIEKLPALLNPATLSPGDSVILSVLGATALLTVVGIRYPIKNGTQAVQIARALEALPSQQPQNNTPEPYFSSCTSIPDRSYPLVHGTTATKGTG